MPNVTAEILSPNVALDSVNIPRKRGRPPKSKVSEVIQPNKTPSSTNIYLENVAPPTSKVAESFKTNPTQESANIPRKRGRPRKFDASKSFITNEKLEVANASLERTKPLESTIAKSFEVRDYPESADTPVKRGTPLKSKIAKSFQANGVQEKANNHLKKAKLLKSELKESVQVIELVETTNVPQKKCKKAKPKITSNQSITSHLRQNSADFTTCITHETSQKQLKFFPIFNRSISNKNNKNDNSNKKSEGHEPESCKTYEQVINNTDENIIQKTSKVRQKKQKVIVKELDAVLPEVHNPKSLDCSLDNEILSVSHNSVINNEVSKSQNTEPKSKVSEVIQPNDTPSSTNTHLENIAPPTSKVAESFITNPTPESANIPRKRGRPRKSNASKSFITNEKLEVAIVKELDAMLPEVDNPKSLDCSLDNEISSVSHNSVINNKVSKSQNSEQDIVVSEIINQLCLKTVQSIIDSETFNDITADEKLSVTAQKTERKLKRKNKFQRSIENNLHDIDTFHDKTIEGASARRKSLRSRGVRNDVNYSEIDLTYVIPEEKLKSQLSVPENKPSEIEENDLVLSTSGKNNKRKNNLTLKASKESKSVKVNLKLFPIFTSNKATTISNENKNVNLTSKKRKASCDEMATMNNGNISDDACEKNCKNKRVKSEITDDTEKDCEILSLVSSQDDCNSKLLVNKKTAILKKKNNYEEPKSGKIVSNEEIKTNGKDNVDVHVLPSRNVPQVINYKKPVTENLCFPTISHVNVFDEFLPEASNNSNVGDDTGYDIIIPAWDKVQGIIDSNCNTMIKSKASNLDPKIKFTESAMSVATDENVNTNMLWTDFMQNASVKENRNEATINEIKSWLLEWKDKFSKTLRTKKCDSDSDSFSSDSDSDDDSVTNSIIINGAPGTGKTNLVFRLANELGFTVIEVNASSSRSGRNISSQLKEALESYHMESIKVENPFEIIEQESRKDSRVKIYDSKGSKKNFESNDESSKRKQSIANFFQPKVLNEKEVKTKHKGKSRKSNDKNQEKEPAVEKPKNAETSNSDKNSSRISSLTIILFDDVDIVFEEDEGFWGTVRGFLKISKKPVIFTVGRNLSIVKSMLNSDIQIFNMMPSSKESSLKMLKSHCENHSRANTNTDLELLTLQNVSDLRRNILNAQFWTQNPSGHVDLFGTSSDTGCKSVHVNSFIAGDLKFTHDQAKKLLFNQVPNTFLNAISQYQSLGYDVLYSNLFYLLDVLDSRDHKNVWKSLVLENSSSANNFTDSQMWEEACKIFKQKKKALKSGAASKELITFADIVDNFSYADMLKGLSSNRFQWIPVSERIKLWTDGLPMCCDHNSWPYEEDVLQSISLINIIALRQCHKVDCSKSNLIGNNDLILEHPLESFDQVHASAIEDDLHRLSAALPLTQQLNKSALSLDYLSTIKIICREEECRQLKSGKRSGRFLHYFDSISFFLEKRTF